MKFSLQEIQEVLSQKVKSPDVVDAIVKVLEKLQEEKKDEQAESTLPKAKNTFTIVVIDEAGDFKDKSLTGYVVKHKDGDDTGAILSQLSEAARAQNEGSRSGKKNPLVSMTEIFGHLKRKFLKLTSSASLTVQTKEPVRILVSNNKLV